MSLSPRPLADLLPAITRPALASRRSAASRLAADWPLIVGARLAAITHPCKLASHTLSLACDGPTALELQHGADQLIARINRYFGNERVKRLRLLQRPLPVSARVLPAPALPRTAPLVPAAPPDGFPPGPVRDALARLAGAIASPPQPPLPEPTPLPSAPKTRSRL